MTNGENILEAILDEVARFSFLDWLNEHDISEVDFGKFLEAGKKAVDDGGQNDE